MRPMRSRSPSAVTQSETGLLQRPYAKRILRSFEIRG